MEKEIIEFDWELLDNLSYRTNLGKSLKNTLRKFKKEELFAEIKKVIEFFWIKIPEEFPYQHRIKAFQSCILKYEKYYQSKEVEKVFNDILGIRIIVEDYSVIDNIALPDNVYCVNLRDGKSIDDGYRGVHLYFQKDHNHYPIELQIMTKKDVLFNNWLHDDVYKYKSDDIGITLRKMYDQGLIKTHSDFRKELANVLSSSEEV